MSESESERRSERKIFLGKTYGMSDGQSVRQSFFSRQFFCYVCEVLCLTIFMKYLFIIHVVLVLVLHHSDVDVSFFFFFIMFF